MSIFEKVTREQQEALQRMLDVLDNRQQLVFRFDTIVEKQTPPSGRPIQKVAHTIPCDYKDGGLFGYFLFEDKAVYSARLGFRQTRTLFPARHFQFRNGQLTEEPPQRGLLYIPVQTTGIGQFLCYDGNEEDDHLIGGDKREPLHVLGIQREWQDPKPLMLLFQTEKGIEYRGIAKTISERIVPYAHVRGRPQRDNVRALLESMQKWEEHRQEPHVIIRQRAPTAFMHVHQKKEWHEPSEIVKHLDRDVIGQEDAKKIVGVSVALHLFRYRSKGNDLRKGNILLIGPSGTGKTHIARTLEKLIRERVQGIKYSETSVPGKSTSGYVSENFSRALDTFRDPKDESPYGILFVDEIDKTVDAHHAGHGFFEERIQRELIGMLEDTLSRGDGKEAIPLRTRNILFIAAGAFQGLDEIIQRRIGGSRQIGFVAKVQRYEGSVLEYVTPEDLVAYGLKPELVGRFSHICVLHPLTDEQKVTIFRNTRSSPLRMYEEWFRERGYSLSITDRAAVLLVNRCSSVTGARSLDQVCAKVFLPVMHDETAYVKNGTIYITEDLVREEEKRYDSEQR